MNRFEQDGPNDIYRGFQKVLIAQNRIDTALEVAEQGRAYTFKHLLVTHLNADPRYESTSELPSINEIKEIAKRENSVLVQYSIIYDSNQFYWFYKSKLGFEQQYTQATLLYIWVVQPTGEVAFRQIDLKLLWKEQEKLTPSTPISLVGLVRSVSDSLRFKQRDRAERSANGDRASADKSVRDNPDYKQKLQQLYQLLIQPIAELLPSDPDIRVTFIPQDFLFLVPFAALQDSAGKYLIEKHTILTVPAIQVLAAIEAQQTRRQKSQTQNSGRPKLFPLGQDEAIVVGNPTMPSVRYEFDKPKVALPSLPETQKEAEAIAKLLGTKALTGSEATKAALLQHLAPAKIIHLATYGCLDDIEGIRCAIALAPLEGELAVPSANSEDSFLKAGEIINMYGKPNKLGLNAHLVVLSGCDAGRDHLWGNGIVGLSLAFITAGVPSIILSLSLIPDAPTVDFMTLFYKNLQISPDKAQALRKTMLKMMKQHPHPKDWALFTLIGKAD